MISPVFLKLKRNRMHALARASAAAAPSRTGAANRSPMVSRSWSGLRYFALVFDGAFDRELQVLAVGIIDLGNARAVVEHAAKRRRAGLAVEHAAGRMRKRRGIDLAQLLGIGAAQPGNCDDQADDDAPGHALGPLGYGQPLDVGLCGIKADVVHIPAFMADSSAIGPSRWAGRGRRPYRARCRHKA